MIRFVFFSIKNWRPKHLLAFIFDWWDCWNFYEILTGKGVVGREGGGAGERVQWKYGTDQLEMPIVLSAIFFPLN